jgi:hypothetical protein
MDQSHSCEDNTRCPSQEICQLYGARTFSHCSLEHATVPSTEPDECNPHPDIGPTIFTRIIR